jgi:hypothetical protein
MEITERSLELFLLYAKDSGNWSGTPLVGYGGNVSASRKMAREERGNISQLKQAGLITTWASDACSTWMKFTKAGKKLAAEHGIDIIDYLD